MALYRARWVGERGEPRFRDFHSKAEAEAFRALPRDNLVFVELYKDPDYRRLTRPNNDGLVALPGRQPDRGDS